LKCHILRIFANREGKTPIPIFLKRKLHIVSFDVPVPPDYGGVMDIYATAATLHARGIEVILHCFIYGKRRPLPVKPPICSEIFYYKRRRFFSFFLPYIVYSRCNKQLFRRLLQDDAPVLLEGIHCSYPILDDRFVNRKMALRLFNVEFHYYQGLAAHTHSWLKRFYYRTESRLLKNYEQRIAEKATILALSEGDAVFYKEELCAPDVHYLPVSFYGKPAIKTGTGNYCLYHGNLSVAENEAVAIWLAKEVFNDLNIPFIIAGKNPSSKLKNVVKRLPFITLKANPDDATMAELVADAQLNVLPSLNSTGVKLKILFALYNGRFCITNPEGAAGFGNNTGLFTVAGDARSFKEYIITQMQASFSNEMKLQRVNQLEEIFGPEKGADALMTYLY
jgi:glycosyltransferase involved in cell wall biosynthesis